MQIVLFVLKVNQYFSAISGQINLGPIQKLIFWQHLSTTGSVNFEDKITEKYVILFICKRKTELPLLHVEGRVEKIKWSVDVSVMLNKVHRNKKRGNGDMHVASPVSCFHSLLSMCLCVWQGETQNTQGGAAPGWRCQAENAPGTDRDGNPPLRGEARPSWIEVCIKACLSLFYFCLSPQSRRHAATQSWYSPGPSHTLSIPLHSHMLFPSRATGFFLL